MNIILLAMSTLPDSPERLRPNSFHVPCDNDATAGMDIDDCRSQLEPVVLYYLRCISEYGKDNDIECLMLETDATSNDYNNYGITAADYFKQRINESKEAQGLPLYCFAGNAPRYSNQGGRNAYSRCSAYRK